MLYGTIVKKVTRKLCEAKPVDINAEFNNCMNKLNLTIYKEVKRNIYLSGDITALYALVGSITITNGGSGYSDGYVTFTGGAGVEAVVKCVVTGGVVTSFVVLDGGRYTTLPTGLTCPGGGANFAGTVVMDTDLVVESDNHGLTTGMTVTITDSSPDIDGAEVISNLDINTFRIEATWTATGTGSWTATEETDTFDLADDVIAVKAIYLNSEKINQLITRREIVESDITENDNGCFISEEREIIFPATLSSTDSLYIIAKIVYEESENMEKDDEISLPDYYLTLVVDYILKELFLYDEYFDDKKYVLYSGKYDVDEIEVLSILTNAERGQRINVGAYDLGYKSVASDDNTYDD